ncbi:MAG TPA: dTDP-4-dehydrorhamnose 3,5-epimerase [Rhizomicrobium sp.]|nr:dTDP-4-dehydrorhamnose 3,5-epimerase [Rhizomicrobium sp.]
MSRVNNLVEILAIRHFSDQRGSYLKLWSAEACGFAPRQVAAITCPKIGVFRGLHWQAPPHAERKLVTCPRGAIFDIAVNMDPASPGYRSWQGMELTADDDKAFLIPPLHAHGFLSLSADTLVVYASDADYIPEAERGLLVTDPALGIVLPVPARILSTKDASWPPLASFS